MSLLQLTGAVICKAVSDKFKLVQLHLPPFLIQHLENNYATYGRLDEKDYDPEDAVQFSENVLIDDFVYGETLNRRVVATILFHDFSKEVDLSKFESVLFVRKHFIIFDNNCEMFGITNKCQKCFDREFLSEYEHFDIDNSCVFNKPTYTYGIADFYRELRDKNNWCKSCLLTPLVMLFPNP